MKSSVVERRRGLVAAVAVIASVATLAAQERTAAVPVFVTSAGAVGGFTDPNKENQDAVKDLRASLKGRPAVVVVDAKFIFKNIETELSGSIRGEVAVWRRAADKIGDQVEAWVKANRARLDVR